MIVEDDESIRSQMKWALSQDYEVFLAEDRPSALEILKAEQPPVVTLDLGLPPNPGEVEEGFLALSEMLGQDNSAKVIVITAYSDAFRPLIPIDSGHLFRSIPATHSGAFRPPPWGEIRAALDN